MKNLKSIVSLETALLLRDLGFNVEVIGSYDLASRDEHGNPGKFMRSGTGKKWDYNAHKYTVSAPTIQEAMDWLKNVHNIELHTKLDGHEILEGLAGLEVGCEQWVVSVNEMDKPEIERLGYIWECYSSEEKAIAAGIYKACELIKSDKNKTYKYDELTAEAQENAFLEATKAFRAFLNVLPEQIHTADIIKVLQGEQYKYYKDGTPVNEF